MISFRSYCFRFSVACMLALTLLAGSQLAAQESYNVGDKIRIEFMRKQVTGTITEALRGGLYKVDLDQGNDRFLPPMTLVQERKILGLAESKSAKSAKPNSNSTPATKMGTGPNSEIRSWRDKTGKFEMQGSFVDLVDGNVTLKKTDGKQLTLPLEKLNPEDATLAESLKKAMAEGNPFAGGKTSPANPFAGGEVPDNSKGHPPAAEPSESTKFTVKEMDFSSVKIVKAELAPEWKVKPVQALPIDIPSESQLYPIKVAGRRQIIRDMRTPNRIFIGNRKLRERIEEGVVVDLASGKSLGPFTYPMKNVTTIAFDSKSNQLLTATTTGERDRSKTVDVWRINGNDVEHKFGFVPTNQRIVLPVNSGMFLDSDRVLLTIFGKAGIYNLKTMKGEAGIQFFNASRINIGPNGKYLFGRVDDQTAIFDIEAKKNRWDR